MSSSPQTGEVTSTVYLYGLTGFSVLTVISPLIIFSVPMLLIFGWVAVLWWRNRDDRSVLALPVRIYLACASISLLAFPAGTVIWYVSASDSAVGVEAVVLLGMSFFLLPFGWSAVAFARDRSS